MQQLSMQSGDVIPELSQLYAEFHQATLWRLELSRQLSVVCR